MNSADVRDLIARQHRGWSLEQAFYISSQIYALECSGWLARQWYILGHCSELPGPGHYIVRDVLNESVIIVRDADGAVRCFYNLCRHRGSRLCDGDGRAAAFICPYHAWSYRLDGSLRSAPGIDEHLDSSKLGLRELPVQEMGGLVVGTLTGDPQAFASVRQILEPGLRFHGISNARMAARRRYTTHGNWKLVVENFIECYHCVPAHPEYCSVMKHVDLVGRQPSAAGVDWERTVQAWLRDEANQDSPLGSSRLESTTGRCAAIRGPIGSGRKTQSQDGLPVAPLMGEQTRFDGGVSGFRCEPFIFLGALNDHAVMFQFMPAGPEITELVVTWLVDARAAEADVDLERMMWLWEATMSQDKALIERAASGVRSRAYTPGPYTNLESWPARFVSCYLDGLSEELRAG